ncbi:uncharacterized protein LOC124413649 [Diprion similis]|uniref:uncharacterized protein LOC124413649 n=1 Tax=Diprion similis TaxID=362088 RepID=UPI001EF7B37F|nr:uncharacterized protein LOC124413649 [Diprion similis]
MPRNKDGEINWPTSFPWLTADGREGRLYQRRDPASTFAEVTKGHDIVKAAGAFFLTGNSSQARVPETVPKFLVKPVQFKDPKIMKIIDVLLTLTGLSVATLAEYDGGEIRDKRQIYSPILVEPYGGTFKLIIGIGIPIALPGRSLVYGQNMQFQYPLPTNATFFTNLFSTSSSSGRRRRSSSRYERQIAYSMLEQQFDRSGANGKECIMRGICEAAETPLRQEGLVGELLHLLLTPDYGGNTSVDEDYVNAKKAGIRGEDCAALFPGCPHGYGILDHVSTTKYVN